MLIKLINIQYKENIVSLLVHVDAKVVDLLREAKKLLSYDADESRSLLVESYHCLGIERHIRRYEYVQDVIDCWNSDQQNSLVIRSSDSPAWDYDLTYTHAPRLAPQDLMVYMYYSQDGSIWHQRYTRLLSMG
jgi:hypothetical protein